VAVTAAATAVYAQRIWVGGPTGGYWRGGPPNFATRADLDGSFNYCRGFYGSVTREQGGGGWEREGESRDYFDLFSPEGYAIGVNFVLYVMTH
jgi:hypothetical protein